MNALISRAAVALALITVATNAEAATLYRLTDLGALPGSTTSVARAISNSGAIAGESGDGALQNTGVRFDGGITALPTFAGVNNTVIRGINNSGISAAIQQTTGGNDRAVLFTPSGVVQLGNLAGFASAGAFDVNNFGVATGYALLSGTNNFAQGSFPVIPNNVIRQVAVRWTNGVPVALSDLPALIINSAGSAINDAGMVAGNARLSINQLQRAILWGVDGSPTFLALGTGQIASRARAINEAGSVAGQVFFDNGDILGSVWSPSNSQFLLNPTAGFAQATTRGINSAGTVVGFANDVDGVLPSFGQIWTFNGSDYTATALDSLVVNLNGWQTQAAQAINDRGQIVGIGIDPNGFQRAYLLTPIPEPGSWAMMITGFGLVGGTMRRRRKSRTKSDAESLSFRLA
jgi:uncharacterized membrane protein